MKWYIMVCVENCVCSHVNHINWRDYSLIIFPQININKKGFDQSKPWHVHSNPHNSENCLVNKLDVYLLLDPQKLMGGVVSCFIIRLVITGTQRLSLIS